MQLKQTRTWFLVNCSTVGEPFKAFVPNALPPVPPLDLSGEHFDRLERANRALGKLDGLSRFLPDVSLFVYWFVRKEAGLSSHIEGTQSSLSDLLLYEQKKMPGVPLEDVEEVSGFVSAVRCGAWCRYPKKIRKCRLTAKIRRMLASVGSLKKSFNVQGASSRCLKVIR